MTRSAENRVSSHGSLTIDTGIMSNFASEFRGRPVWARSSNEVTAGIIERLTVTSRVRDRALGDCRQVVRWSANSVRASHRGDFDEAREELDRPARLPAG